MQLRNYEIFACSNIQAAEDGNTNILRLIEVILIN